MADLDYRIILGSRPIPSLAEQRDQQTARQIQQQEVELRRQEILARRDALREQARMRAMPPPVDEAKAFDLRISKAKTLANLLRGADAETYPHVRELARQLVGDDAVQELPEQFDAPTIAALAKFGDDAVAQAVKTREVRTRKADGSETIQIVEDKPGQVFESAAAPEKPATSANPTEASLALLAANGDKGAARALEIMRRQKVTAGGSGSSGGTGLVDAVMANPSVYDTLTPSAKTAIASELAKRGFDFAGRTKSAAPTGAQGKNLNFFNRAKQASEDLAGVEGQIANMGTMAQGWNAVMPSFMQSETGQLYEQAQRAFTEARLRKESGAAIANSEYEKDRKTYFVQPGDSPATIAQKQRARANLLASLAFEAGPAFEQYYGDQAKALMDEYRAAARPGGAKPAGAAPKADPLGIR